MSATPQTDWKFSGPFRYRAEERFVGGGTFRSQPRVVLDKLEIEWDRRWHLTTAGLARGIACVAAVLLVSHEHVFAMFPLGVALAFLVERSIWAIDRRRTPKVQVNVTNEEIRVTRGKRIEVFPRRHTRFVVRGVEQGRNTLHQVALVRTAGMRESRILAESETLPNAQWLADTLEAA